MESSDQNYTLGLEDYEGLEIVNMYRMTDDEKKRLGWEHYQWGDPIVIELSNGHAIYPSKDAEGNGPGVLFFQDENGNVSLK